GRRGGLAAVSAVRPARAAHAGRGTLRPALASLLPPQSPDVRALSWLGLIVDARPGARGRWVPAESWLAWARPLSASHGRAGEGHRRAAQRARARPARRGLRVGAVALEQRHPRNCRGR